MILDGKGTAAAIRTELKERAESFFRLRGRRAGLAVVMAGEDPASQVYVRNKIRGCEETGIRSFVCTLPADCTQDEAERAVSAFAENREVDGILVQLPLPRHLDGAAILAKIPAEKDVDGFSPVNVGKLARMEGGAPVACTPLGVIELLSRYGISVAGKRAVVVGRSNIVGRPMALLLLNADATVTVCHSKTERLREICAQADILVVAAGKPNLITREFVKEGAVVIDVGTNRGEDGKLRGDVDFEGVSGKAAYITPVPGGVGPMTIAMLLKNTVEAAERSKI